MADDEDVDVKGVRKIVENRYFLRKKNSYFDLF